MLHLRRLLPAARPYWAIFAAGFVCVLLSNFFTTLAPRFLQQGIDALGGGGTAATVRQAILSLLAGQHRGATPAGMLAGAAPGVALLAALVEATAVSWLSMTGGAFLGRYSERIAWLAVIALLLSLAVARVR